jgi:uncharacterized protein YjbI with pentapeptide repeats
MSKKKERKSCQHKGWYDISCPHDYFSTYTDPETGEETDYCIFHAPMNLKQGNIKDFWDAFDQFYCEILADFEASDSGDGKVDIHLNCQGFIFPEAKTQFKQREFPFWTEFYWAKFEGETNFAGAKFDDIAGFSFAEFRDLVVFRETIFNGSAVFTLTKFAKSNFYKTVFKRGIAFQWPSFFKETLFVETEFNGNTIFLGAQFVGETLFNDIEFKADTSFEFSYFPNTIFKNVIFNGNADFSRANTRIIIDETKQPDKTVLIFYNNIFKGKAKFRATNNPGLTRFEECDFYSKTDLRDFSRSFRLKDLNGNKVSSERIELLHNQRVALENGKITKTKPGIVIVENTFFHNPELVQIGGKDTDLGLWSFKDSNIEQVNFVNEKWQPKTRWRGNYRDTPYKPRFWPFKLQGRKVIYDEILTNEDKDKPDDEKRVTWEDAGQVYRRLRKNFEKELAYELASDFHYGQMECRRLNSDRAFLHPDRVFVFLYKIVSGYGERFLSPLLWLLGSFVVFTVAFMFLGYKPAGEKEVIWRFCSPGEMFPSGFWSWVLDLGKAVTFTLRAAVSFRLEDITKEPVIFLAHMWKLFAVIFTTFFILALRRRFKK